MQNEEISKESLSELKQRAKWLKELKSADKAESDWREKCKAIYDKYRGDNNKKNSFNILFSNTDTLSPAVYNSKPNPDVRRRWSDDDPLGKAVSEVLTRALSFSIDTDDFEQTVELNVYDYLLSGRAVSRVRYVPSITQSPEETVLDTEEEMESEQFEEIEWEQVVLEHVQYDDYRRGPARSWGEVTWQGFRHRLDKEEIAERFGEDKADSISFDPLEDGEKTSKDDKGKIQEGTTEIWEIWDKNKKQVVFVSEGYKDGLLKKVSDPLQLKGFWPTPKPLYAFIDPTSLIPVPLFALYEQQALELDRISARIIKLIAALKVRGIYDANIAELSQLFNGEENELYPAQNVSMIMDRGGLDNAIWFMDIQPIIKALEVLYEQREQTKQVIYEIMGLSDILRGSSNANETATAQGIKAQWGGMRVNRMQRAIQLYMRDIVRLMAELIGQKFQIKTLQGMTGLKFPTDQEAQQQMMQRQMQAQIQGQEAPPQLAEVITWEQIKAALSSDISREFKVDVETDSTISASQQTDMQALKMLLDGIASIISEFTPVVQAGAMPIEAVKELIMAVIRRAKLGNAVEDAFEKISSPPPPQPKQDPRAQIEQAKLQTDVQLKHAELAQDSQAKQAELEQNSLIAHQDAQIQLQLKEMDIQAQYNLKQMEIDANYALKQLELEISKRQPPEGIETD